MPFIYPPPIVEIVEQVCKLELAVRFSIMRNGVTLVHDPDGRVLEVQEPNSGPTDGKQSEPAEEVPVQARNRSRSSARARSGNPVAVPKL